MEPVGIQAFELSDRNTEGVYVCSYGRGGGVQLVRYEKLSLEVTIYGALEVERIEES